MNDFSTGGPYIDKFHFLGVVHVVDCQTALIDEEVLGGVESNEQLFCIQDQATSSFSVYRIRQRATFLYTRSAAVLVI